AEDDQRRPGHAGDERPTARHADPNHADPANDLLGIPAQYQAIRQGPGAR
ncbi:MAG: hypothetical protein H7Y32_13055, partial [Chloroflexales bacterium]|nr:hypothetical protein [Chloroflexales bacterium]